MDRREVRVQIHVEFVVEDAFDALPFHHSSSPCTGSEDPKRSTPLCYKGKGSILGGALSETIEINVKSFEHEAGVFDVSLAGAMKKECDSISFKKRGSTLVFDNSCLLADVKAKYCSDQDAIAVTVSVKEVPTAVHSQLTPTPC